MNISVVACHHGAPCRDDATAAGSWNTAADDDADAQRLVPRAVRGGDDRKGPSPPKSRAADRLAVPSENTPTSRSTVSPLSSSAIVGRPGILRRYEGGVGGGKGARES